jgi:hypothetical protein
MLRLVAHLDDGGQHHDRLAGVPATKCLGIKAGVDGHETTAPL